MHKRLSAATIVLFIISGSEAQAQTPQQPPPHVKVKTNSSILVESSQSPEPRIRKREQSRQRSQVKTWSYWDSGFVDGQFCRQRRTTTNEAVARGLGPSSGWISRLPDCTPAAVSSPAEVADGLARSFWDVRVLPSPVLKVVPDYAITGKPVYLQIEGPRDQAFHVDNPIGDDVAIAATSRYVVDWGDGTTETTTSQGGPWPSGDVTHTYTDAAAAMKITVTQLWSAAWTAGPAGGELGDLRTTSTLALPVTQLQAVRNR